MENFKVAFASNDGDVFNVEHFGDSNYYYIYEINKLDTKFIKTIKNNTKNIKEEVHADPNKAKGVSQMMKEEAIKVVVAKVFGPNIKRINKNFVCVIIKDANLAEAIERIQANLEQVREAWNKGEKRSHLIF